MQNNRTEEVHEDEVDIMEPPRDNEAEKERVKDPDTRPAEEEIGWHSISSNNSRAGMYSKSSHIL